MRDGGLNEGRGSEERGSRGLDEDPIRRDELRSLTGLRFVAAMHVLLFHTLFTFSRASVLVPPGPLRGLLSTRVRERGALLRPLGVHPRVHVRRRGRGLRRDADERPPLLARAPGPRLPDAPRRPRPRCPALRPREPREPRALLAVAKEGGLEAGLSALLVQAWVPAHALDLNGPAWSLSVEAFFYLCFPLLVRLLAPLRARWLVVVGGMAWAAAVTPALVHKGPVSVLARTTPADLVLLFDPLVRLPDFVVGVVAGLAFLRTRRARERWTQGPFVGAAAAVSLLALLAASERIPLRPPPQRPPRSPLRPPRLRPRRARRGGARHRERPLRPRRPRELRPLRPPQAALLLGRAHRRRRRGSFERLLGGLRRRERRRGGRGVANGGRARAGVAPRTIPRRAALVARLQAPGVGRFPYAPA